MHKFRRTLGATTLIHDKVVNLNGEVVGKIEELMLDVTTVEVAGNSVRGTYRYTRIWARDGKPGWRVVGGHVSAVPVDD